MWCKIDVYVSRALFISNQVGGCFAGIFAKRQLVGKGSAHSHPPSMVKLPWAGELHSPDVNLRTLPPP